MRTELQLASLTSCNIQKLKKKNVKTEINIQILFFVYWHYILCLTLVNIKSTKNKAFDSDNKYILVAKIIKNINPRF